MAKDNGMGGRINTVMQTCFFALSGVLPREEAIAAIKHAIEKTYGKRGEAVVQKNFAAVDNALAHLARSEDSGVGDQFVRPAAGGLSATRPSSCGSVLAPMMAGDGDQLCR